MFREAFLNKLNLLLRGTVAAPADRFGETLADEHMMGGEHSFCTVLAHQHAAASPAFAIQPCIHGTAKGGDRRTAYRNLEARRPQA